MRTLGVVSFANPRHPRRCGYEDPAEANFRLACRIGVVDESSTICRLQYYRCLFYISLVLSRSDFAGL